MSEPDISLLKRKFQPIGLTALLGLVFINALGVGMILLSLGSASQGWWGYFLPSLFFGVVILMFGIWCVWRAIMTMFGFITKDSPPDLFGRVVLRLLSMVAKPR